MFFPSWVFMVITRVGTGLKKQNAATRTILGEGVLRSYRVGAPNFFVGIEHLKNLANIRDLLDGCMYPIPLVTRPQAFKVSKDPTDGNVKMQVQQRSYNDAWGVIDRCIYLHLLS